MKVCFKISDIVIVSLLVPLRKFIAIGCNLVKTVHPRKDVLVIFLINGKTVLLFSDKKAAVFREEHPTKRDQVAAKVKLVSSSNTDTFRIHQKHLWKNWI